MASQLSVVLDAARAYLNDPGATIWTDAKLIPLAQEAHRELQSKLWNIGSPLVKDQSSPIPIPASSAPTDLTSTTLAPANMITPTYLQESLLFGGPYQPMLETSYLSPGYIPQSSLIYWMWKGEHLFTAPSYVPRYVVIRYRNIITIPTVSTSDIGISFGEIYMSPRLAALAFGIIKEFDSSKAMSELATANLGDFISPNRGQNRPAVRP